MPRHIVERTYVEPLRIPTKTTIDLPHPVAPVQRRRRLGAIVAAIFTVVLAATSVAWGLQTDGSPDAPSDRPERQETPSLLESPADFDKAIADAIADAARDSEDDSIILNADAFNRAVEAAR